MKITQQENGIATKKSNWFYRNGNRILVWSILLWPLYKLVTWLGYLAGSYTGYVTVFWLFLIALILYICIKFDGFLKVKTDNENSKQMHGLTDLMVASGMGHYSTVKELLKSGADSNEISLIGSTALMYAVKNNHFSVVQLLVEHGASVGISTSKGSSAILLAEKLADVEILDFLKNQID